MDFDFSNASPLHHHGGDLYELRLLGLQELSDIGLPEALLKSMAEESKAGKKVPRLAKIGGVACIEEPDIKGEVIDQAGWIYTPLLKSGSLVYEHGTNTANGDELLDPIGVPLKIEPSTHKSIKCHKAEGVLYLEDPTGKFVYDKSVTMQRAGDLRRYGFSSHGYTLLRDKKEPHILRKTVAFHLAVALAPAASSATWEPLAASVKRRVADAAAHGRPLSVYEEWVLRVLKLRPALTYADASVLASAAIGRAYTASGA